jgi:hypothetical protein
VRGDFSVDEAVGPGAKMEAVKPEQICRLLSQLAFAAIVLAAPLNARGRDERSPTEPFASPYLQLSEPPPIMALTAAPAIGIADDPAVKGAVVEEKQGPPPDPAAELIGPYRPVVEPNALDPPLGFTGPSSVVPRTGANADFEPVEDRWRIGFPFWDRYGKGFPLGEDYPYKLGRIWDPFNQNVLKGDYPIIGQHTFFIFTARVESLTEGTQLPTPQAPFESTARPFSPDFFGHPNQLITQNTLFLSFDLLQGDGAFKPADWRIKATPAFNLNTLGAQELGIVSPDVTEGTGRLRGWVTLQEYFVEFKLADLSPEYDFVSARVGSQPFTSDFRGFIFSDTNRAVRLFGTLNGNQDQFNLIYFRQDEKDTDSTLNSFNDRNQNIVIANWYHQDFIFPGYTAEWSIHYNNDAPSMLFDRNGFLVRPDPVGIFQQHRVETVYLGFAGDGHMDRFNVSNAFYWVLGRDSLNPMAGQPQIIDAQMAALEVSYDRDWARFRVSGFFASGDGNANNRHATGFDSIMDDPNFAGSEFSFWGRQAIALFGVNLTQRNSLVADLRSSKIQGQSNFVNPGIEIVNGGVDFDVTPKFRIINNVNFMWFDKTSALENYVFQGDIDRRIGLDLSTGFEYRPLLSNNIIFRGGVASLIPAKGFKELYSNLSAQGNNIGPLVAAFLNMELAY